MSLVHALSVLPGIIANSGDLNVAYLVAKLRVARAEGNSTALVDLENRCVSDLRKLCIIEHVELKRHTLALAVEPAEIMIRYHQGRKRIPPSPLM